MLGEYVGCVSILISSWFFYCFRHRSSFYPHWAPKKTMLACRALIFICSFLISHTVLSMFSKMETSTNLVQYNKVSLEALSRPILFWVCLLLLLSNLNLSYQCYTDDTQIYFTIFSNFLFLLISLSLLIRNSPVILSKLKHSKTDIFNGTPQNFLSILLLLQKE